MNQWMYRILGEEFGPVTAAELNELLHDGILSAEDQVRTEHSSDWLPLGVALEPDRASTDDQLEIATSLDDLFSAAPATAAMSSNAVASPADPVDTAEIRIDEADEFSDRDHPLYFTETMGQTLGPLSFNDLSQMIQSGLLSATDLVRNRDHGAGIPAHSHPRLRTLFQHLTLESLAEPTGSTGPSSPPAGRTPPPQAAIHPPVTTQSDPETHSTKPRKKQTPRSRSGQRPVRVQEDKLLDEIVADVLSAPEPVKRPAKTDVSSAADGRSTDPQTADGRLAGSTSLQDIGTRDVQALPESPVAGIAPVTASAAFETPAAFAPVPNMTSPTAPPSTTKRRAPAKKAESKGRKGPPLITAVLSVGVVAVAAAWYSGLLSAGNPPMDTLSPLQQFQTNYETLSSGEVTQSQWETLRNQFRPEAEKILQHFDARDTYLEENEKWHKFAAMKLIQLVDCPLEDTRLRAQCFTEFTGMVARGL